MSAPRKNAPKKPAPAKSAPSKGTAKTRSRSTAKTASKPSAKKPAARRRAEPDKEPRNGKPGTPPRPDQMDQEVVAFINAIEEYKRQHQRPFPNWSEILEVVKSLGYARR